MENQYNERYFRTIDRNYELRVDKLRFITLLNIVKNVNSILDAGCGSGYYLPFLSRKCKILYGVDNSHVGVEKSKEVSKKYNLDAKIYKADISKHIPIKNKKIDIIFCTETIEHIKNIDGVLKEFKRILKDNGRIIISVPNFTPFSLEYLREIISEKDPTHVHRYTLKKWKNVLGKYFSIEKSITSTFLISYFLFSFDIKIENILKIENFVRKIPFIKNLGRECIFILKKKNNN